jgi:flagella synthesis protein FlgN
MPDLKNLINEQLVFLETLKTQLEQELHLISSRDAESLTKLINAKSAVLVQISNQDKLISSAYSADYNDQNKDQIDPLF